uniref:Trehalase n=1 Tax=Ascaris suum TaxID=6253 RepID=F1KYV0_ASCSU
MSGEISSALTLAMVLLVRLAQVGSCAEDGQTKRNFSNTTRTNFTTTTGAGMRTNRTGNERHNIPTEDDVLSWSVEAPRFACDENTSMSYAIYCQGKVLHTVAMLNIFKDSKTFVDKPMKRDPEEINADFKARFSHTITTNDREAVRSFIEENFGTEGDDLSECANGTMSDWVDDPEYLISIDDNEMRRFALEIHALWKKLCRTIKKEVKEYPQRYSLLYVPNEFIIPGGRFRELYYWDSYWVVKGLIASGMHETAKHVIENFRYLIHQYGFIPSGNRNYYLRRTQPPLFIPMVYEYHTITEDDQFLISTLDAMETELAFWKKKRTRQVNKNGKNYTIFQYNADTNVPRPESYREDFLTAQGLDAGRKRLLWKEIANAAESGWDFSSRWLANGKTMDTIETSNIAPVDLNAIMCWNMEILAHLHGALGNSGNASRRLELNRERAKFVDTFEAVFFDDHEGAWFDVNLRTMERVDDAYPSIAAPLFAECYSSLDNPMMIEVLETLHRKGLLQFPGGVPTSLIRGTHQQWDYPNGFAPINHMVIEGLRKSNHPIMQQKAFEIASKWINRNYRVYMNEHKLWQKYDVAKDYLRVAKGGEYDNQAGFGWTNGALLDLLVTYSKRIRVVSADAPASYQSVPGSADTEATSVLRTPLSSITLSKIIVKSFKRFFAAILRCK